MSCKVNAELICAFVFFCTCKNQVFSQGWDKFFPAGKFQWKMPDNAGRANTPKITEVANTGTYEQN